MKKPFYKRAWFWTVLAIFAIGVFSAIAGETLMNQNPMIIQKVKQ